MSAPIGDRAKEVNSTKAFLTSLVANVALLSIEIGAFLILKARLGRIYSPRTYLPPPDKRATPLPGGYWRWIPAVLQDPLEDIITKNGLDAYMFLRFLKMLIWIFSVFTFLTFAVIIPLDAVNVETSREHPGLEKISWTNVTDSTNTDRFWGHIVMVYILTFVVFLLMRTEMLHYVHMRHKYLNSKVHMRKAQARTVLITNIPKDFSTERDLRIWSSFVPGGVARVWLYHDTKVLNELFEKRLEHCTALEDAIVKLLRNATLAWRSREKAHKRLLKQRQKSKDAELGPLHDKLEKPEASEDLLNSLVPVHKRPHHRTGPLGIYGTKVESIPWYRDEIKKLNNELHVGRETVGQGKFMGSAFIRCNIQLGASVMAQCVSYHEPGLMIDKWMEAHPRDVVWANLDDGPLETLFRRITSWLATIGLIIGWAPPAIFIGGLSSSSQLCNEVQWLEWICTAPDPIPGIVTGIVPPVLLALVFVILPFILRALAWYECLPRYSIMSVSVYKRFYLFLLLHGFLIVTLSSGIVQALSDIVNNPTTAIQNLASQLPAASIFFLTYMVTQGLSGAGTALVQLIPMVLHFLKKFFIGRTPRQAYGVTFMMPAADFGLILPRMSLLATIGLAYSVLTPFINLMALTSFTMFYFAWKYLLTQVFDQPDEMETAGMYYPMAMQNLFVGLYIEHVCLTCLFFLKSSYKEMRVSSLVQAALMLTLLVMTAFYHAYLSRQFYPISQFLPMSMATKKLARRYSQKGGKNIDDLDLFATDRLKRAKKHIKLIPKVLDNAIDEVKNKVSAEFKKGGERRSRSSEKQRDKSFDFSQAETSAVQVHDTIDENDTLVRVPTRRSSQKSYHSKRSKTSSKKSKRQSHPIFDPPAPALSDSDDSSDDEVESDEEHAFSHPATYKDQPFIWIPQDVLGLSKVLIEYLDEQGVSASDLGSVMSAKGVVEVMRGPPDEEWHGGHDN